MTLLLFILFALFFSVYTVLAQTSSHKDIVLVEVNPEQLDYEGYLMLDMDKDSQLTEEDLYLKLELINEQVANTSSSLKYISTTYNMTFRLTPLATNLAIKNSASMLEYQSSLSITKQELQILGAQINGIQNAIGDLDWYNPNIAIIKQEFNEISYNIFLANWYVGER